MSAFAAVQTAVIPGAFQGGLELRLRRPGCRSGKARPRRRDRGESQSKFTTEHTEAAEATEGFGCRVSAFATGQSAVIPGAFQAVDKRSVGGDDEIR